MFVSHSKHRIWPISQKLEATKRQRQQKQQHTFARNYFDAKANKRLKKEIERIKHEVNIHTHKPFGDSCMAHKFES